MANGRNMATYAQDAVTEQLTGKRGTADDLKWEIEQVDESFDGDSYMPYYSQQDDFLSEYESDFGRDAEDILGDTTYKADEWQQAKTAYAYAVGYMAFSHFQQETKDELSEGIDDLMTDIDAIEGIDNFRENVAEPELTIDGKCPHGWASHDRELEDGTMIFESKQLDGCNAISKPVAGIYITWTYDPKSLAVVAA